MKVPPSLGGKSFDPEAYLSKKQQEVENYLVEKRRPWHASETDLAVRRSIEPLLVLDDTPSECARHRWSCPTRLIDESR